VARYSFLIPSLVMLSVLVSRVDARQAPGSAGATRPNVRVLQALPEAQLFPLMNLLADSLGVRCDYCHVQTNPDLTKSPANVGGWVWSSDDKPQKRIARDMMRMMIDLNTRQFKGAARVTCYTCHRGGTDPARLPPIPPSLPPGALTPSPIALPSADRVWNSYVSAVGKADPQKRGTGTIISGWDDRPEGRYGKVEIVTSGTDRFRATLTTAAGVISQGFDDTGAWTATNNVVQRLAPENAARLRSVAMRYGPVRTRPANLEIVGLERIAGREAYVARARINPTTTLTLYFDVVTGLLRRELTTTETILLPLEEQVDYDDYRDVGGVQLPFRVQTSDGSPFGLVTRTFLEIRRNVAVSDALFRAPGGER
jgi:hypothetical protein